MYTDRNFKTKSSLKKAIADGAKIRVYNPGLNMTAIPQNGVVYLEGPHYPEPHRWYGQAVLQDGFIIRVK